MNTNNLESLCRLVRYDIISSTTEAGSGHPTSSLSAVELMTTLFFGRDFYRFNTDDPKSIYNDRVIFSKGHASPLLYSLFHVAGLISTKELMTLRQFGSRLEGHPTPRFPYADVATGSLGQGLSIGVGMALAVKSKYQNPNFKHNLDRQPIIYVLLGDSELAEGQNWEAMQIASHYNLNNLVGILDVNRLGQRGATMLGWDLDTYRRRIESFGWRTIVVEDGHDISSIFKALESVRISQSQLKSVNLIPTMIIAKTIKGKGIRMWENKDGWHSKTVPKADLKKALKELGQVDLKVRGTIAKPIVVKTSLNSLKLVEISRKLDFFINEGASPKTKPIDQLALISTKSAYGDALVNIGRMNRNIVALDAEVSNSTHTDKFKSAFPDRFFEMFIAEQNMVSTAVGLSSLGLVPFVSTFAAFFTRAFDQLRMADLSNANLKCVGSYAGVSIGKDGSSQMGLEDIAMFRSLLNSIVLYPSDAISAARLVEKMLTVTGITYLRTTREPTPVIYGPDEEFEIGGSKIIFQSRHDKAVVIAAGITLHEAIAAYHRLKKEFIPVTVVDLYSIKPLDETTLKILAAKKIPFITVEDHYPAGGIGEAVRSVLSGERAIIHELAVQKPPRSGSPAELLRFEEIDAQAIVAKVKTVARH